MLRPKIVVNLNLKRGKTVERPQAADLPGHGFRSVQHETLDSGGGKVVQNEKLKFVETSPHTVKTEP
jgi:hypothetical protein